MKRPPLSTLLVNVLHKTHPLLALLEVGYRLENIDCDFIYEHTGIVYCTLRLHTLHADLTTQRLKKASSVLANVVVLCLVDSEDSFQALISLNRVCAASNCVLVCVYTLREAISYVHALCDATARKDTTTTMISDVCSILSSIRGINKVDVHALCHNYCSFSDLCKSNARSLSDCPGVGVTKAQILRQALQKPIMIDHDPSLNSSREKPRLCI